MMKRILLFAVVFYCCTGLCRAAMTGDRQGPADLQGLELKMLLAEFAPSGATEGDVVPDGDTPAWTLTGGDYASSDGDVLTIDTTAVSDACCLFARYDADVDFDSEFTLEVRARIDFSGSSGDARCMLFDVRDGTQAERVYCYIRPDRLAVHGAQTKFVGVNSSQMRVYRLVVKGQKWEIFIDDEFVVSGTVMSEAGSDLVRFGDGALEPDKNSRFAVDYFRYRTSLGADNYTRLRVAADALVVGNTGLCALDDTVTLADDLDSASAQCGEWYRLFARDDGQCFFSLSPDAADGCRPLAWVRSEDTLATDMRGGRWVGDSFFYYSMFSVCSTASTVSIEMDCRDYMPPGSVTAYLYLYAAGTDCALYFYLGDWAPIIYQDSDCIQCLVEIQGTSDRFIETCNNAGTSTVNHKIYGYKREVL